MIVITCNGCTALIDKFSWSCPTPRAQTVFNEEEILSQLPPTMSTDLVFMMYEHIISGTPLFAELGKDLTTKLCLALQPYPAMRGDVIMREEELGAEMFIVVKGEISISRRGKVLGSLSSGSFFGETAILDDNDNHIRKRTGIASVVSDLSFITRDSVEILSEHYPSLQQQLFRFSKVRSRRVMWQDQPPADKKTKVSFKASSDGDGVVTGDERHDEKPEGKCNDAIDIRTGCKMIVVKAGSSKAGKVVTVIRADWHGMVKVRPPTLAHAP